MKEPDGALIRRSISLTSKESSVESSKQKRRCANVSVALGSTLKRVKRSMPILKEEKEVGDASTSEKLPLSLVAMKESDNSPVSSGFPSNSNLLQTRGSVKENNLAIKDSLKSKKNKNVVQNTKVGNGENLSCLSRTFCICIYDQQ